MREANNRSREELDKFNDAFSPNTVVTHFAVISTAKLLRVSVPNLDMILTRIRWVLSQDRVKKGCDYSM